MIGIEKDGIITASNPFNTNTVVFAPAGRFGTIKNAFAMEQLKPVESVAYATSNMALISRWAQNEPYSEFIKAELNAMPSVSAIDSIFHLNINP
jgi:hypothetical protein